MTGKRDSRPLRLSSSKYSAPTSKLSSKYPNAQLNSSAWGWSERWMGLVGRSDGWIWLEWGGVGYEWNGVGWSGTVV